MLRVVGEVADGVHVHPMHSMHYIKNRLLPGIAEGAARAGRDPATIDKIIPVIVAAGDTPEERAIADQGSEDDDRLLRRHAELRLPVRRPRLHRPARPAARLPQDRRQRARRGADHRRDPRPVRRGGALGRRRRPHDRALQGHRLAPGHLPRLALARGRSEDPRALGRGGARGAQGRPRAGQAGSRLTDCHLLPQAVAVVRCRQASVFCHSCHTARTPHPALGLRSWRSVHVRRTRGVAAERGRREARGHTSWASSWTRPSQHQRPGHHGRRTRVAPIRSSIIMRTDQ